MDAQNTIETDANPIKQTGASVSLAIFVAALLSLACNLDKFVYPPVIPLVVRDLRISFAQAGFLMSVVGIMGIFLAIPGGILISRIGIRKSGAVGLFVTALGSLVVVVAGSYLVMVLGRAVAGVAERLVQITALSIVGVYVTRERNALAQGVISAMIVVSVAASGSSMGFLGATFGWQSVFLVSIIFQLVAASLFLVFFLRIQKPGQKDLRAAAGHPHGDGAVSGSVWTNKEVWKLTIIWACYQGGSFIQSTWFPTLLKDSLKVGVGMAGLLASIGWWMAVASAVLIGWVSDASRKRKIWMIGPSIAVAAVGLILSISSAMAPVLVLVILTIICGSMLPGPLMATVPEVVRDRRQIPQAFGILSAGLSLALFVVPTLAGWLRDISGSFTSTLYLMAALSIICAITASTLKTR